MSHVRRVLTLDFCDTLTPEKTIKWADKRLMPPWAVDQMEQIRQRLLPKLEAGTITREEMDGWTMRTFEIYAEVGVTRPQVVEAMRGFPLRDGITDLLHWAREQRIPVAIISGSCADFIHLALSNAGIDHLVEEIVATRLTYRDDLVTGARPETMVTNFTKGERAMSFASRYGLTDHHVIAVGDSNNDDLLAGANGTLIGIAENEARAAKLKPRFNRVVISKSLKDVLTVVQEHAVA